MKTLSNAQWGFESNCFVCEPANPHGLHLPFAHDEEHGIVVAEFTLGTGFSGAPAFVHGGIVAAILDEAMAWAAIAIAGSFAVTSQLVVSFDRPVRIDRPHRVQATVLDSENDSIRAEARLVDAKGRVRATGSARLVTLSADQAANATGAGIAGPDLAYVRRS